VRRSSRTKHNEQVTRRQLKRRAYFAQGGLCFYCSQPFAIEEMTADHCLPRYAGGMTKAGNIVAACAPCNNTRNEETNRRPKGHRYDPIGDDTPRSPFEILKGEGDQ
jgi:5-methylcytosine-specific restriction endonuclease McrA